MWKLIPYHSFLPAPLEARLEREEAEGLRLLQVKYCWFFKFEPSKQKPVQYCITNWTQPHDEIFSCERDLKTTLRANPIPTGTFMATGFYRVTMPCDLKKLRLFRDQYNYLRRALPTLKGVFVLLAALIAGCFFADGWFWRVGAAMAFLLLCDLLWVTLRLRRSITQRTGGRPRDGFDPYGVIRSHSVLRVEEETPSAEELRDWKRERARKRLRDFIFTDEFREIYKHRRNRILAVFQTIPRLIILGVVIYLCAQHQLPFFVVPVALIACLDLLLSPKRYLSLTACVLGYVIVIGLALWRLLV